MREIEELENFMKQMLAYAKTDYKAVMSSSAHSDFEASHQRFADKYFSANDWINDYFRRNGISLPQWLQKSLSNKEHELVSDANGLKKHMEKAFAEWEKVKNLRSKYRLGADPKNDFDYITMQDLFVNSYVSYASRNLTGVMDIFRTISFVHHAPVHKRYDLSRLNNDLAYRIGYNIGTVAMKLINRLNRDATHSSKQTYAAGVGGGAYEASNTSAPMDQATAERTVRSAFSRYVNRTADKYYDYTHDIVPLPEGAPDIKFKVDAVHGRAYTTRYADFRGIKSIIIDGREFSFDELPKEVGSNVILDGWGGYVEMNEHGDYEWYKSMNDAEPCYRMKFDIQEDLDSRAIIYDADGQRYPLNLSAETANRERKEREFECYEGNRETINNIIETYCASNDSHGIPTVVDISSNFIEDNDCSSYYVALEKGKRVFYTKQKDGQYKKMEILGVENCKKVISKDRNEHTYDILSEDQDCIRYKVKTGDHEESYDYIYEYRNDEGEVCFGVDDYDDEHEPYIRYTGTNRLFSNDNELLRGLFDTAYNTNTTNNTNRTTYTNNNTTTNNSSTNSTTTNSATGDTSPRREIKRETQRFDTSDLRQGANRSDEQSRVRDEQTKEQNDRSNRQAKYEEIRRRRAEERKYSNVSDEEEKRRDAELERARAERAEQEKAYREEFGVDWDDHTETHSTQKYVRYDRGMSR